MMFILVVLGYILLFVVILNYLIGNTAPGLEDYRTPLAKLFILSTVVFFAGAFYSVLNEGHTIILYFPSLCGYILAGLAPTDEFDYSAANDMVKNPVLAWTMIIVLFGTSIAWLLEYIRLKN